MSRARDLADGTFNTALNVTGTATADALTVETGDSLFLGGTLRIKDSGNTAQRGAIYGDSSSFHVNAGVNNLVMYTAGTERVAINSVGTTTATTYSLDRNSVRTVRSVRASSNFSNPTVTLLTITTEPVIYSTLAVKVIVRQHPWSNTTFPNQHEGFATSNNGGASRYVTSMSVTQSATSSTGNVGTLSWSGDSLQYTTNRASNYDQYYIEVEISASDVAYTT